MGLIIRHIELKDNQIIADLIRIVFREFKIDRPGTVYYDPTTDDLFSLFKEADAEYWIAEDNNEIIGGCGIFPTPDLPEGCIELVKFYLHAAYRGKGIGLKLLDKCIESACTKGYKQIYLESMPELSRAIGLYKKAGFRFIPGQLGNSGHFGCTIWMLKNL